VINVVTLGLEVVLFFLLVVELLIVLFEELLVVANAVKALLLAARGMDFRSSLLVVGA